jgi:hypothetical protein
MPRLHRLAVCVLLLAPRPSVAAATEQDLIMAAQGRVAACAKASLPDGVCTTARDILAAYLGELKAANKCIAKPCKVVEIDQIFRDNRKLDELESTLPDAARADATGRPLLRLSLLVTQRASIALASVDPKGEPPPRFDPEVDAPRSIEEACLEKPAVCGNARMTLAAAIDLRERVDACAAKPCDFDRLDETAIKAEDAMDECMKLSSEVKTNMLTIFSLISDVRSRFAMILVKDASDRLAKLNGGIGKLNAGLEALNMGAPGADAVGLEAQVKDLSGLFREASLGRDRVASFLFDDKSAGAERARLNEAASRLASSRSRLLAMETARGLNVSRSESEFVAAGAVSGGGARKLLTAQASAASAMTLLDRRTIPKPAPLNGTAPPILAQAPSFVELVKNLASSDPVKRADARRRAGLSVTVGDPSGRAALVHGQQYDDTCAVVSQQEVLQSLHLLGKGDQNAQETQLREEARKRGFYRQGTPDYYSADILVDRGVLVAKEKGAPLKSLDAAVRRGGMVIASVDARYLWNRHGSDPWGHAIVVTGAEIDRWSGKTVGYYINDSGSNPPGHGRFVPHATFEQAWIHHTRSYAEIK